MKLTSLLPAPALLCLALGPACTDLDDPSPSFDEEPPPEAPSGVYNSPSDDGIFSKSGAFVFTGPTTPGTAMIVDAPVIEGEFAPEGAGTGSYDITMGGVNYADLLGNSLAVAPMGESGDYLVAAVHTIEAGPGDSELGTIVNAIIPADEAVAGATIALDGQERVVIFAHGDVSQDSPEVAGAAVTGTITVISAGTQPGDLVTLSIDADFGPIEWDDVVPPSGEINLVAGDYSLTFGDESVQCDGDLAGQEAAFSGLAIGYQDGASSLVELSPGSWELSGAAVIASFGTSQVLSPITDAPPGTIGTMNEVNATGPLGSTHEVEFITLDGESASSSLATGYVGAGFMSSSNNGSCGVWYPIELSGQP